MKYTETKYISKKLIQEFSELSGDKNPIHLDEEYCKITPFGKPIAHGLLLASFFSGLYAEKYPGHGSILLSQSMNFLKPCFVEDTVIIKLELIEENNGKYKISSQVLNQDSEILFDGEALLLKR